MPEARSILFAFTGLAVIVSIVCIPIEDRLQHVMPLEFSCTKNPGTPLPSFPPAFSADIRLNLPVQTQTVELRHYKDTQGKRESLDILAPGRHVKYIVHGEQHLVIKYPDNDFATCSVSSSSTIQLENEDSGPDGILKTIMEVAQRDEEFYLIDTELNTGVFVRKWEGCFKRPLVNVSFSFSEIDWKNPGSGTKNKIIPVFMEGQIGNNYIIGVVDNFQASVPEDINFQPPADVYCEGFREDKKPPEVPDFFSYDAESVMYSSMEEIAPLVFHRSVYFDYPSRIHRIDFYDLTPDIEDIAPSDLVPKTSTVIHDFNSRVQYMFYYPSMKCELSEFETTEGVEEEENTNDKAMLNAKQYFGLDAKKISYNGQFMTRGFLADVYTAMVPHLDGTNGKSVYSWFFSSVETEIAEKDKAEKNVLLRMIIHPESGTKRTDRYETNLFHFTKQIPSIDMFDITNCYDETQSKLYVITFPANKALRGTENFLKLAAHIAIKQATGLTKQRIYVSEVVFTEKFMFVEFKLLEPASVLKKDPTKDKEDSLAVAAAKLREAVSSQSFKLTASTDEGVVTVLPLKDGFNEFSGDRKVQDPNSYGQGSVIGLTIGMLLLGFVVGGIVLNLVMSRKFGVSLWQSGRGGTDNFNNPLKDSAM